MSRPVTFFLVLFTPILAVSLAGLGAATLPSNRLGWFLLFMGLAYAIGGPLYVWKKKGEPPASKEERGDRSFWLVQPGFIIVVFGAPLEYLYLPVILQRSPWMQWTGLLMVIGSVVLLTWARRSLRGQFSGHIQIQAGHQLVENGPYKWVRHPGYSAYLLMALGVAVGYYSLVAVVAVFTLLLPGLMYRITVEERLLVEAFGNKYRQYRLQTKRLIPGVW